MCYINLNQFREYMERFPLQKSTKKNHSFHHPSKVMFGGDLFSKTKCQSRNKYYHVTSLIGATINTEKYSEWFSQVGDS